MAVSSRDVVDRLILDYWIDSCIKNWEYLLNQTIIIKGLLRNEHVSNDKLKASILHLMSRAKNIEALIKPVREENDDDSTHWLEHMTEAKRIEMRDTLEETYQIISFLADLVKCETTRQKLDLCLPLTVIQLMLIAEVDKAMAEDKSYREALLVEFQCSMDGEDESQKKCYETFRRHLDRGKSSGRRYGKTSLKKRENIDKNIRTEEAASIEHYLRALKELVHEVYLECEIKPEILQVVSLYLEKHDSFQKRKEDSDKEMRGSPCKRQRRSHHRDDSDVDHNMDGRSENVSISSSEDPNPAHLRENVGTVHSPSKTKVCLKQSSSSEDERDESSGEASRKMKNTARSKNKHKPPSHLKIYSGRWTNEEEEDFILKTLILGPGNWMEIKEELGTMRSSSQLKDKWRSLKKVRMEEVAKKNNISLADL